MVYYQDDNLLIRSMIKSDIDNIMRNYVEQNWHKPIDIINSYYLDQEQNLKVIIVAEMNNNVVGYVTLLPCANVGPFSNMNIPEIVDFIVFIKFQRQGIGSKIMNVAEYLAKEKSSSVSLSVGLHSGYGSAQRMYIKRGYIPDGSGVWYKDKQLEQYADCKNDDDLVLFLLKRL